jgi:NADH-quinone oxidoreductase subunit F
VIVEPFVKNYLSEHYGDDAYRTLAGYEAKGGFAGLKKALALAPEQVTELVKASGLRGRGGAGFATGLKWSFMPKTSDRMKVIVVNGDESEPGSFKDRLIMERGPFEVLEGLLIGAWAMGAQRSYIYVRGEYAEAIRALRSAVAELYKKKLLGKSVMGKKGFDHDVVVHGGAGAYICGEETALLESLEGKKGQPRFKPPFPASYGLFGRPTTINNTETLASVPDILRQGGEWFLNIGKPNNGGSKLFSVSGHVNKPGNYEIPLGTPFAELLKMAGGVRGGRKLKDVIPGGSSTPVLRGEVMMELNMDYDSIAKAGSMLGAGSVIVMDDTTCMVRALARISHFYYEESCGQCTPCREGTGWLARVVHRIEHGEGRMEDLDLLVDMAGKIEGRTICALGDAAAMPVASFIRHFRDEFEYHIQQRRCRVVTA